VKKLAATLWRIIRGPLQWRVLWLWHATFMVGVTGVVRDSQGRVLLLKHRMWPQGRQWGLPTGYANKGERFEDTVVREVREETGLTVRVHRLVHLKSGYKLRVEVAYEAEYTGGTIAADSFEILEAKWFTPDELPGGLQESHRTLILTPPTAPS
jgi:8-oxo-dGTP diphosphatase